MKQIGRNLLDPVDGFLRQATHLIHDRDPVFTAAWTALLETHGVECVAIPAQSPNCNPHAERFVKTVRTECLGQFASSANGTYGICSRSSSGTTSPSATTRASAARSSDRLRSRATTTRGSVESDADHASEDSSTTIAGLPHDILRRVSGHYGLPVIDGEYAQGKELLSAT
jgi:hypothetical protein